MALSNGTKSECAKDVVIEMLTYWDYLATDAIAAMLYNRSHDLTVSDTRNLLKKMQIDGLVSVHESSKSNRTKWQLTNKNSYAIAL